MLLAKNIQRNILIFGRSIRVKKILYCILIFLLFAVPEYIFTQNIKNDAFKAPLASKPMTGSIAVALFFVESDGTIDPNTYSWDLVDENLMISNFNTAIGFWQNEAAAYGKSLNFIPVIYRSSDTKCRQGYEPILHNYTQKSLWINAIMNKFGYTNPSSAINVNNFNLNLKSSTGAGEAFSIFICYNPSPAPVKYNDGISIAYSTSGAMQINMLYRNDTISASNSFNVFAVFMGKLFGALDECCNCVKIDPGNPINNSNCINGDDGKVNPLSIKCIMRERSISSSVCGYTAFHLGWCNEPFLQTITSFPVSLQLTASANGETLTNTSPTEIPFRPGTTVNIKVASPQKIGSDNYYFSGWSDGGDSAHNITITNSANTYTARFEKISPPNPPILVFPEENAKSMDTALTLKWRKASGTTKYEIQLALSNDFSAPIISVNNISDTVYFISGLAQNTRYYWRVNSANIAGTGDWQTARIFSTFLSSPVLVQPLNNATGINVNTNFEWTPVAGATSYEIQISTTNDFGSIAFSQNNITTNSFLVTGLSKNVKYYWRVMANSVLAGSAWSEMWTFKSVNTTAEISVDPVIINIQALGYLERDVNTIINITNKSNTDNLVISSIYFNKPNNIFTLSERAPVTINPNSTKSFNLKFHPDTVGALNESIHIDNSSNNLPVAEIKINATVLGSNVNIFPDNINFGEKGYLTESKDTIITIENTGNYNLKIASISLNTGSQSLSIINTFQKSGLAPGEKHEIKLRLTPSETGSSNNSLIIKNNSQNEALKLINISYNIKEPNLVISNIIKQDSANPARPKTTIPIIIKNTGINDLKIIAVYLSGDTDSYHILNNVIKTLKANTSDSIIIEFYPYSPGIKTATINIITDDPLAPERKINLVNFGGGYPSIFSFLDSISFGNIPVKTKKDTILIIENKGNLDLSIKEMRIVGNNKECFSISGNVPKNLLYNFRDTVIISAMGSFPGIKTAQLEIYSNDLHRSILSINLSANIKAPQILKSLDKIIFNETAVGDTVDTLFYLTNNGNSILKIDNMFIDGPFSPDFKMSVPLLPIEISEEMTIKIPVKFIPLGKDVRYARISIISNDPLHTEESIVLRGSGNIIKKPKISVPDSTLNFELLDNLSSKEVIINIKNTGDDNLFIDSIWLEGRDKNLFSLLKGPEKITLNPAKAYEICLKFTTPEMDTLQLYSANLLIRSNDPQYKTIQITLLAKRSKKEINITFSDTSIQFGNVMLRDTIIKYFTISNNSQNIIKIDSIYINETTDEPFKIKKPVLPLYVDNHRSCSIPVSFNPKNKKYYSSKIYIMTAYPKYEKVVIELSGYTLSPLINYPEYMIFSKCQLDSFKILKVKFTNSGDAALKILKAYIYGKDSLEFSISGPAIPLIIEPDKQDSIYIKFKPYSIGIKDALLVVLNNSPDSNIKINISAEGVIYDPCRINESFLTYYLFQNYPNPFNSATKIKFTIPVTCPASLKVYNLLGKEIITLFSGILRLGIYEKAFYADNLTSGVYYYRLLAGNYREIRKMIIIK